MATNNMPSILDPDLDKWIVDKEHDQQPQQFGVLQPNKQVQEWLARLQKQAGAYKEYKF